MRTESSAAWDLAEGARAVPLRTAPAGPVGEVWRRPLPFLRRFTDRALCRVLTRLALTRVISIEGLEHLHHAHDPFVLVLNHNQRLEAVLLPSLLIFARGGKLIHFVADWPTLLIPVVGSALRRSEVIVVGRKSARIRPLNLFRPLLANTQQPMQQAAARLRRGSPVGIFPEGTMNRDPERLLRGHTGAAWLSLTTGAPVVPAGISFPGHDHRRPIGDTACMQVRVAPPVQPPACPGGTPSRQQLQCWHAVLMTWISDLSGKHWEPRRST